MTPGVLVVDDDESVSFMLGRFFERKGWRVWTAADPPSALARYDAESPELILLDAARAGLHLLEILKARDPDAAIIALASAADPGSGVQAVRAGAECFLTRPVDTDHLDAVCDRALETVQLRRRTRFFADRQIEAAGLDTLAAAPAFREILRQAERLAPADTPVLILGETGTCKRWVAHRIHSLSPRSSSPFLELPSAGLEPAHAEAMIFGQDRTTFSSAAHAADKRGQLDLADGGTLFLAEIGHLPPTLHERLQRLLENGQFNRAGGARDIDVDVRLIAATRFPAEVHSREGLAHNDIRHHLAAFAIRLPPLRECSPAEIVDLALRLLDAIRTRNGQGPASISPEALQLFVHYPWPGNIRELRIVLERAAILAPDDSAVLPSHLPAEFGRASATSPDSLPSDLTLAALERTHIAAVLARFGGNRVRAARALGISRAALYDKLARQGLSGLGREANPAPNTTPESA